jgi:pimeloyl-ACP methyl ester carboxylesterase/predicted glycosyltransferase
MPALPDPTREQVEQTRARYPDQAGYVERAGVRVAWERYGSGDFAVLLMPTWEIVHSRIWKCQIPFLARTFTVLTFDPRGHGRSDRPTEVGAYDRSERALDALAVLDVAGVERVTLVSWCAAGDDLALAALHPERIEGIVMIAPDLLLTPTPNEALYERIPDWRAFVGTFFSTVFPERHSTKQIEDAVGWGLQTDADTILRGLDAAWSNSEDEARELLAQVRCPTLVVQGSEDQIAGPARGPAVATELKTSELLIFEGSGHGPHLRDPVRFNLALRDFVAPPQPQHRRWSRARSRHKRAIYVSSPIGLGHVRRDVAIAGELRRLHPDLEIDWLAQHPVTAVLEARGERIHRLSTQLASESGHMQAESREHDLHCFQALRRMDEILLANFMVFLDAVQSEPYDLWIGDEAWDVDYYLHENPELKSAAYAWLTDFVGYLPMDDGDERERFLTADYNAEMIEQIARYPRVRDRAIFVGEPEDIVPGRFGPGLPPIRDWTEQHFSFAGYITGFDPAPLADRAALRRTLGYQQREKVCIVTVGGSGIGSHLLRRVIESYPDAKRLVPELRMIVVTGPRIDPGTLPASDGLEIRSYVPDLHAHLAACDLAVVQGGLTTAMELTAHQRPFIYFPLGHHFEQNFHVQHRLQRHRAGRRLDFDQSPPEAIAKAIATEIGRDVDYLPVEANGATRAATIIAELL